MNATRHGIYAQPAPIPAGVFAEDRDEIDAFVQDVIDGLTPTNEFQRLLATRVATALLHAARLDRYAAHQIAQISRLNILDGAMGALIGEQPADEEIAAGKLLNRPLDRIFSLDAKVGRELERALATYARARGLTSGDT